MYALYVCTRSQFFLFAQFGGFHGVLVALTVALRQQLPEERVPLPPPLGAALRLRNKHLPGAYLVAAGVWSVANGAKHHHIGLWLFAAYGALAGWCYLRYFQRVRRSRRGDAANRARSSGNIARERGSAPGSTRAPRAFAGRAPSCRHLRHIRGDGSHACSTKGARRRRARAARASAREARRGLRRVERSRHEPPRISGGENQPLVAHVLGDLAGAHESSFMPQHANRGVLKHAARGCGSGREGDQR